ncbi:MAG TPA: hypothetical protein PLD09_03915 [Methanomassiliicoccaceae archaeon]|jgi:hypothetical protein|nr:hypothetical protein [Methanomassiliicoccaceae archaeon]HOL08133.1 hypothetical protein [Methanomassiliicoccaceae archaeon]HPP44698.1 hypothetical protein [Methanomassiliicoccaceae archaeon]HQA21003.1 hypothetical protein [Methanomassiliicoccaceae archaeon]
MIDLSSIMARRAENVTASDPDLTVRYSLYTDDRREWGILHILDPMERVVGLEFFESEDSWTRPNAVNDYNMAAHEGFPVSVVIPDAVFIQFIRNVHDRGGEGFSTYLLSELNLAPRIRA